jgi:ATP-binding cassette subfamily C exporter for protease/lipase
MNPFASRAAAAPGAASQPARPELVQVLLAMWPSLRRAFLFSLVAGLLVLAPSVYMLEVYARVVDSRSHMTLWMLTLAVLVAFAVMEVLEWVRSELLHEVGHEADARLSPRLFNLIFEANLKRQPGGTMQPLNDWRTLREFLYSPFVLALMESPLAIVFLVLVYLINPLLGWVTLGGAVLQVFIAWLTERRTQPPLAAANRSAVGAQQYADGSLRNAEVIEAMGMLRDIHRRWIKRQREFLGLQAQASQASGGLQAASKMLQQVLSSALLGLAAWLSLKNELHGGPAMMIVASIIGGRVLAPLVQMVAQWRQVVNAREAWTRLNLLLSAMPPREPSMPLPAPRGVLTVEQLVAGPPPPPGQAAQPFLRGIQFELRPGEVLAVIGPSASGKTTLARMLVGLWPAINGKVRLDGADVQVWDKTELGPHLGYLPQGVELFEGTVAENIARFGETDMAKVRAAAQAVGLLEFINALPQGFDTPVGREGAVLSGGQRQRVALARAMYGEPALVVLDEPNSSLDEAGDAALAQALQGLKARGATVVVMTHRASVLSAADKILLLADGAQQAFGPRDEVLAALNKAREQATQPPQPAAAAKPATAVRPASLSHNPLAGPFGPGFTPKANKS